MISDIWKTLLDYLKRTPQWPWLEPVLLVGFLYTGVVVAAYQYVQWRYGVTLPLPRFLGSYVFRQVSIAFGSVLVGYVLLVAPLPQLATAHRWTARLLGRHAGFILRLTGIALVATVGTLTARALSPHTDVGSIRVMIAPSGAFGAPADTAAEARPADGLDMSKHRDLLIYLLFELNRLQQTWHFVADFTPFRKETMPAGSEVCDREPSPLICYAGRYQAASRGDGEPLLPLVVITSDPLSPPRVGLKFWVHSGAASVISTADWAGETMPDMLDYLVYTLTLQAIVTHLDLHCPGYGLTTESASDSDLARQRTAAQAQEVVNGNVFEFAPRREALKAAILAGRLGPEDELRLLNCFGPDYMRTTGTLLGLDWLHAPRIRENLEKAYGVSDGIVI